MKVLCVKQKFANINNNHNKRASKKSSTCRMMVAHVIATSDNKVVIREESR